MSFSLFVCQSALTETQQTSNKCVLCSCTSGPVCLDATLDRSAYCCGEFVRLRCEVVNGTDQAVTLTCRLVQVMCISQSVNQKNKHQIQPKICLNFFFQKKTKFVIKHSLKKYFYTIKSKIKWFFNRTTDTPVKVVGWGGMSAGCTVGLSIR